MAIAKCLPPVIPFFMQDCPLCSRSNRIVVKGQYKEGNKIELMPDLGYSFCNCSAIFYTREENVVDPVSDMPDADGNLVLPDPFFAWPDPYTFHFWDVRRYQIIWDMESKVEQLKELGFTVTDYYRDFDVHSKTPQHYHVKVKV